jgi:hypothetical protein
MGLATALLAGHMLVQTQRLQPIWPGFGVNIHFTDPQPGEMSRMSEAGFQYTRMDFHWQDTEIRRGVYDFSAYDRLLNVMKTAGIKPLWILDYGHTEYQNGPPTTAEARAAFAKWAAAAVSHFKGESILWEIWNEPNLEGFWKPRPDPAAYKTLAIETAQAMKEADPTCRIIAPGVSGVDFQFLGQVLSPELLSLVDGVSVHPYRESGPEAIWNDYGTLRSLIRNAAPTGRKDMPIISSEWGYSTFAKGGISEERQALYLVKMWLVNAAAGVPVSIFYDWKDDGNDPNENEHRFGTVRQDLTPKPSFIAAKQLLREFQGCTNFRRLTTKDPLDWIIVGGGPNKLVQARWYQKKPNLPKYQQLNLNEKANRRIHTELMGAKPPAKDSGGKVTSQPPVIDIPITVAFAPPLDANGGNSGWVAIIQKPLADTQKVEFKYTRKSNGAKVTCFCKAEGLRDVEALACDDDELAISTTVGGKLVRSANLNQVQFDARQFRATKYVENIPGRQEDLRSTERGFVFPYSFESGWQFYAITPAQELAIPNGARKFVIWVKLDKTSNTLRSRFRDETGRTFQVDLGRLDDREDQSGWRAITIALDGSSVSGAWGGSQGAKPTGKLAWEALLVVDSANRNAPQSGALEIGGAAYEF